MSGNNPNLRTTPFADGTYPLEEMVVQEPPVELSQLIEEQLARDAVVLASDDFTEIKCVSQDYPTATFMVRRRPDGNLDMLVPASVIRKPN